MGGLQEFNVGGVLQGGAGPYQIQLWRPQLGRHRGRPYMLVNPSQRELHLEETTHNC